MYNVPFLLNASSVCNMTFYYNDAWLGFLTETFIREAMTNCEQECPGCRDGMRSAVLHLHQQLSLLDKLRKYFEQIRGDLLTKILTFYSQFQMKLPHSDDLDKDKSIYCGVARSYLITCTAETIYYGRYVTEATDSFIAEAFEIPKPKKKRPRDKTIV